MTGPVAAVMDGVHYHSLCSEGAKGAGPQFHTVGYYTDPEALLDAAARETAAGRNVWYAPHGQDEARESGRGGIADITIVRTLPVDLDWYDPDTHDDLTLPTEAEVRSWFAKVARTYEPTYVVETGHGLQPSWQLSRGVDPDEGAELILRMHAALEDVGLVTDCHELSAVFRVPGSINFKATPVDVRLVQSNPGTLHQPEWLAKRLPRATKARKTSTSRSRGKWQELDRAELHEANLAQLEQVEERAGARNPWIMPDGSVSVTRPGDDKNEWETSATIGYSGPGRFHVFTSGWSPFKKDATYSIAEVRQLLDEHDGHDNEDGAHESWQAFDLAPVLAGNHQVPHPEFITRTDDLKLLYPGRTNATFGETESAKSWLAGIAIVEAVHAGHDVLLLDFENGVIETVARLKAMGLRDEQISRHLRYYSPEAPVMTWDRNGDIKYNAANLTAWRDAYTGTRLAVVDTSAAFYELHGLDGMGESDVQRITRNLLDPMAKAGAAVDWIDHVVKDKETRGRWATGSQRKISALSGAGYGVETLQPFGRGRTGRFRISISKDRPGYVRARATRVKGHEVAGVLELTSDPLTGRVTWRLEPVEQPGGRTGDDFDEALLHRVCDAIVLHFGMHGAQPSGNQLEQAIRGVRVETIRAHVAHLVERGVLSKVREGSSFRYSILDPLDEDEAA